LTTDKAVVNTFEGHLVTAIEQSVVVTESVNNTSNKRLAVDEGMTLAKFKEAIRQRLVNSGVNP
ncbi:MAG: hypothetical protein FD130_2092, partial [Halothiobacillaceae bacterium]